MKLSGESRIVLVLALTVLAGLAAFILMRKSDEIERVVDTVVPSLAEAGSLDQTHWTYKSPGGAEFRLKFDSEARAELRWEDPASAVSGSMDCGARPGSAVVAGLRVVELDCQSDAGQIRQTLLISEEDGQRHAALLEAYTGAIWLERRDTDARGKGIGSADRAIYLDEFGKSEPSRPSSTCRTRFGVVDFLGNPAKIRVSRYLGEGEAKSGMVLVGPEYSRRELTAEWDWEPNSASVELTAEGPLELKAGPYKVSPEGVEGDLGYYVEITDEDGTEINAFDLYSDRLEYCATRATEMTVLIPVRQPDPEAYSQQNASFRYAVTKGCNVFAKATNQSPSPIKIDMWTNENDGFGGFAGNIVTSFDNPAIAPGESDWVHAEIPGLFVPASIRSEYGEDLASLNEQWLYPKFSISVKSEGAENSKAICGGGLHFPTDLYAPLEQCMRTDGSVFLDLNVTEQRTSSGCNLSVQLE